MHAFHRKEIDSSDGTTLPIIEKPLMWHTTEASNFCNINTEHN